ncbi:ACP S-malonyltransferase [bacterium]|nr:ACP S-malonyltransferase [bacterium]MBU1753921.1 ACP S-malonyltransferase [bacterium]
MKIGFLYSGQGSQFVGMGKDLYAKYPMIKDIYTRASDVLGFNVAKVSFHGTDRELRETKNAQVVILVHSLAIHSILTEKEITPFISAGHSLGEYSAIIAAKGLSFEDGLRLVRLRGELMSEAGNSYPGRMAAIIGLSLSVVTEICKEISSSGTIVIANINTPSQIILSGEIGIINKAIKIAGKAGAKKTVLLPVSGAFHSPLMKEADAKFGENIEKVSLNDIETPIIGNVLAQEITKKEDIRKELELQMSFPVRWLDSMNKMFEMGVKRFIEVGPGKVLKGLLLNIDRGVEVLSTSDITGLSRTLEVFEKWKEQ